MRAPALPLALVIGAAQVACAAVALSGKWGVDPLCDVDRAADGTCTFASRCPLCTFTGCLLPCFYEPRFTFTVAAGSPWS